MDEGDGSGAKEVEKGRGEAGAAVVRPGAQREDAGEELVTLVTPDQSDNGGASTWMGQTRPEEVVAERFPAFVAELGGTHPWQLEVVGRGWFLGDRELHMRERRTGKEEGKERARRGLPG